MLNKIQGLMQHGAIRRTRKILGILLGVYLLLIAALFIFQRSFLYFPSHSYISLRDAVANRALRELPARTDDGVDLKAWYAPATSKPYTFVFFHGNGDNLASAAEDADPYISAGYGFLVTEYRGYSGLPGKPTEAGLYADARAYMRALKAEGVKSEEIVLFGHSLGTGVATQMAEEFQVGGLVLLAPYVSMSEMAQEQFPYFPSRYILLDRYETIQKIKNVHVPVLIINGERDQLIPPRQGKQLYDLANEPRQFYSIPGHGHNDILYPASSLVLEWAARLHDVH